MTTIVSFFSFVLVSVTIKLVHYWVVLFHPRTADIRSLDSGLSVLFNYDVKCLNNPPVWPFIPRGRHSPRSIPLHLIPSPHWMCFSSPLPTSGSASTSASDSTSDSDSESAARASAARSFAAFSYITSWSHHRQDTLASTLCVARSQKSRIGRVAMYCATIFCLLVTAFLIPSNTVSRMASFRGG